VPAFFCVDPFSLVVAVAFNFPRGMVHQAGADITVRGPFFFNSERLDKMESSIRKLTPEIIEACMDREDVEIFGQTDEEFFEGDLWSEIQAFSDCVVSSEKIRQEFLKITCALYDREGTSANNMEAVMDNLQGLLKSGKVTEWQLQLIEQVCRQFFFLGWHARGAAEKAEQLKRMA